MLHYPTSVTAGREQTLPLHSSALSMDNTGTIVQKNKQEEAKHSNLFITSNQNHRVQKLM